MSNVWLGDLKRLAKPGSDIAHLSDDLVCVSQDALLRAISSRDFECACIVSDEAPSRDFQLLSAIEEVAPRLPVIFYRPGAAQSHCISLKEAGAYDCVTEDLSVERLRELMGSASGSGTRSGLFRDSDWKSLLIGESREIQRIRDTISLVASRRCTVLITGESGTGKELAARSLHLASERRHRKMVAVNCAALPDTLLEAELFGHTKGAFTGAHVSRAGHFETAQHSTLLLDEIGEMPLETQAKLLRVLQEREVQRLGSSECRTVDVRVIAASNRDLFQAVRDRQFRSDLLYRLRVVELRMPALREHLSDIPILLDYFVEKICRRESLPLKRFHHSVPEWLSQFPWPGNIRELENAVESAVILSGTRCWLSPDDFNMPEYDSSDSNPVPALPESGVDLEWYVAGIEKKLLEEAIRRAGGNKAKAANMLRIPRTTLISKFKALRIAV